MKTTPPFRVLIAIALGLCATLPLHADRNPPAFASLRFEASPPPASSSPRAGAASDGTLASASHAPPRPQAEPGKPDPRTGRPWIEDNALALALFAAVFAGLIAFQRRSANVSLDAGPD